MKVLDRHLLGELVKFTLLALLSVVVIYLLIDLFEELNYFTSRKVSLFVIIRYYLYSLPSAISLLYPVSLLLAVFLVYGQLTRFRELHALQSAGLTTYRLFVPGIGLGLVSVVSYLVGNELVTIPFNRELSDLRRYVIERRAAPASPRRQNLYFVDGGRVLFAQEVEADTVMRGVTVIELGPDRRVVRRTDCPEIRFSDSAWTGACVVRSFDTSGAEHVVRMAQAPVNALTVRPADFFSPARPVEETPTRALWRYIQRMKRAGENVASEEVEFHYRFAYSLIGLIVVLLGLPLSVRLRSGGVMFGLGLGLLFSFLYWGAIQTCRAYGTSHVVSPALAAWLPNIVFGLAALILMVRVEQ